MSWRFSTRVSNRRDARWWIGAGMLVSAAAGATYLFDPDNGHARRTRMAQRSAHVARLAGSSAVRRLRYISHALGGRLRHRLMARQSFPAEGRILLDRVESELFTDPAIPHGALTLDVEGTTVTLRGELASSKEIDYVAAAVPRIPGVGAVRNLLHLPGTPAPNKLPALIASAEASSERRWPYEPPPDVDSEVAR